MRSPDQGRQVPGSRHVHPAHTEDCKHPHRQARCLGLLCFQVQSQSFNIDEPNFLLTALMTL